MPWKGLIAVSAICRGYLTTKTYRKEYVNMKSKKITAWILFMAMLVTMMPTTVLGALADEYYPIIITDVFSEMTNDIDGVQHGTDLDLVGATNEILPDFKNTSDVLTDTLEGVSGTVLHKADKDTNSADGVVKLAPMRRKQILTFVAESHADNAELRKFVDEGTSTGISAGAVEIAYLDADKAPLKVNVESEEGKDFVVGEATTWDEAWIDLTTDVQRTNVNLKTFLNPDPSEPQYDLRDTTKTTLINTKKLTAADLFATGDKISFIIYNAIRGDFSGYIRVKIKDNAGYTTVQDYAIVADGQYPSISIKTSTHKENVGEYTMVPDTLDPTKLVATTVANNTFIAEDDFATIMEDTADNKAENEMDNLKKSYRWKKLDSDSLNATLKDIAEGKDSEYEGKTYDSEKIWAMDEIVIDKIAVSDELITSEIDTVKYTLKTFTNDEITDVVGSSIEGTTDLTFEPDALATGKVWNITSTPIVVSDEGFNVLAITATDKSGLKTTSRYYFYIDTVEPEAELSLVELDKNVISLLTVADVVTNRQQAVDIEATDLVGSDNVKVVSGVEEAVEGEENLMYQYRLLATKSGEAAKDTDGDGVDDVPADYTDVVVDKKGNDLSGWKIWTGETETPVIDKEFDGIVQVRVQDRAGNWSPIVSTTSDGKETIITDNTNPVIDVKEYALNSNSDTTGNSVDEIINGTATDILVTTARVTEKTDGEIENEVIHTTTGDVAPWINDSAVLEVKITDEDLANEIRSSGLNKGQINVKAEFNAENENKKIKIWNKNGVDKKNVDDSFNLTEDYIFGTETDKDLTFYIEYEGTGVVDITVSVKDQADVNDGDAFSSIYKTQLRVDKINPYIIYKGYDITDDAEKDLLKANNEKVDYEVRNMPWGPNSQVLEVVVKDDDITPVQSKTKNVKFNADKALDLYKISGDTFTKVKTYAAGNNNIVSLGDCEELANEKYESNVGYKFYLVYEGTGIAKVEFFADDSAKEPNVRDYPSVATAADAEPVLYDAMLRVDKNAPEFKDVKLVEQTDDVDDVEKFELFALEGTAVENVTRKQLKLDFDVIDNIGTGAEAGLLQSGVNYKGEIPQIGGADVAITDVKAKYLEIASEYYDNRDIEFVDLLENGITDEDPRIEYILLPVVDNKMPAKAAGSTVLEYIESNWKAEWITTWNDDIVIDKEFQGGIVLRTIDRVGNIVYSDVIQVIAESKSPLVKFVTAAPTGNAWETLNQYGWSKRDVYFEVKVKDQNEEDVDAGIAKVVLQSDVDGVMSLEGDAIGTVAKDVSVAGLTADADGYISLGYIKATATSTLTVTVYDKAEVYDASATADVAETGNKTVAEYNVNIDTIAPEVDDEDIEFTVEGNNIKLNVDVAALYDGESGIAPLWNTDEYNKHNGFMPLYSVSGDGEKNTADQELLGYYFNSYNDVMDYNTIQSKQYVRKGYVHEDETTYDATQWEIPGVQYALIPKNGSVDKSSVDSWSFGNNPWDTYDEKTGYHGKSKGFENVWHNYVPGEIVANADFDGYIVVRVVDKAGNITLVGTSSILDIEFDNDWKNETQFIQVKASEKNGVVTDVEYFGNNDLLFPDGVHRSLTEALSGEGAFIEVINEGITNVVIKSKTDIIAADSITLSDWEGAMNIGSLNKDWKYQFVDVKIDKIAPEFDFKLVDAAGKTITDAAVSGKVLVDISGENDPIPNKDDATMSQISSGIKIVEWCAVPEGSDEEIWFEYVKGVHLADKTFTGTVKVRVTDNAGNVTEKSKSINIDSATPIISISKSYDEKCSHEPVDVFVTVSESAEFSDIKSVTYTVTKDGKPVEDFYHEDDKGNRKNELPLTGGTISIDKSGDYTIIVTATNKADIDISKEIKVKVHLNDLTMPTINGMRYDSTEEEAIKSGDWVASNAITLVNNEKNMSDTVIWYSLNGAEWKANSVTPIGKLDPGQNTIRIQTKTLENGCGCESDVNTYIINYDNGVAPDLSILYNKKAHEAWSNEDVVVSITANKGSSVSEIKNIKYDLNRETRYLAANGGNIVLQQDGKYVISNIVVEMESGAKYYVSTTDETNPKFVGLGTTESKDKEVTVAQIDKVAPTINEVNLTPNGKKAEISLFELKETQQGYDLEVLATDNHTTENLTLEYAAVVNGDAYPVWKKKTIKSGQKTEKYAVIDKAFNGTVVVKVTDDAGNTAIWTKNVFTEGIDPEISITAPYGWQKQDATVTIDVFDKGLSSEIDYVEYTLKKKIGGTWSEVGTMSGSTKTGEDNPAKLTSRGGQISISNDGEYVLEVTAHDYAGNSRTQSVEVKVDRTAPTYSGSVSLSLYNVHNIAESNWNTIHDGWTYNHAVSLAGVTDATSGLKKVDVKFTNEKGESTSTTLGAHQTGAEFTASGKYELTLTDNAGNVRNIGFTIDETLENVINVVGVDAVGKLQIAVTDGDDMLTFYKKENSESKYTKMYNGITDQLVDGKTGVRYIYGQNDSGKKSNTLYVIVAPSTEYGISLMSLNATPNRYLKIDAEGGNVTVKKIDEIFNPGINKNISVGSVVEINEDGVYSITTND